MKSSYLKNQRLKGGWVKYFIFNIILFGAFFALQANVSNVKAASDFTYEILNSNYKGNNADDSYAAYSTQGRYNTAADPDALLTNYTVQGTGTKEKDVVSIKITKKYTTEIRSIAVFESGYTTSGNRNYDVYRKGDNDDVWTSLPELKRGSTTEYELQPGVVVNPVSGACTAFAATDNRLKANTGSFYSMFCITDNGTDTLTIHYTYTIRAEGYGFKEIYFAFYNDVPSAAPAVAEAESVMFVLSKPISQMEFTWIKDGSTTCGTNQDVTGSPTTDNVCIKYINGAASNQAKPMEVTIPKEVTYVHSIAASTAINDIKQNSIYGINTFVNSGSGNDVRYYYYDFKLYDGSNYNNAGNEKLDPNVDYHIYIMVDAKGNYVLYMKDVFGNTFTTTTNVKVDDVSKTTIIVDYTNEHDLTLMTATGAYESSSWKNDWVFTVASDAAIDFTKLKKDEVNIIIHVFQRIVISNGVHDDTSEAIAKDPLGLKDATNTGDDENVFDKDTITVWRVTDIAGDDSTVDDGVSCGTSGYTGVLCEDPKDESAEDKFIYSNSVGKEEYGITSIQNRIEFTVKSNGRYRIEVVDNYGNKTDGVSGEKNPSVEVSVIDRTTPVITSGLTDAKTSIDTYPYVIGGGENEVVMPAAEDSLPTEYWKNVSSYSTIYYNSKGSKMFNYKDALQIAQIYVVDNVLYYKSDATDKFNEIHTYHVDFNSNCNGTTCDGKYVDPSSVLKSNRNSNTTVQYEGKNNLHDYIIAQNITSFSGGLVEQVSGTAYSGTAYTELQSGTPEAFVNASGDYLGYLKITFKNSSDAEICTVSTTSVSDNQACFKLMNQYIDDVENFKMIFEAQDYNNTNSDRHTSASFTVTVNVIDTTAPGVDMDGTTNLMEYTNEDSECRLEIGNDIQTKTRLLNCYKLFSGTTYKIKDNNVDHSASDTTLASGVQYYTGSGNVNYHQKIKLWIYEEGFVDGVGNPAYKEIIDTDPFPHLDKSGYHKFKIIISDHWNPSDNGGVGNDNNTLTIYVTYYVNPRTLLIEPLANEKMYGEADPASLSKDHDSTYQFDYCVYVNNNKNTFNLEAYFFDADFINTYFTNIYCSKDVYVNTSGMTKYKATVKNGTNYDYNEFAEDNTNGTYVKFNNTYILASGVTHYKLTYTQNNAGNYYFDGTDYHEIKSGYTYSDDKCLYLADGTETTKYLKLGIGNCKELLTTTRFNKTYVSGTGADYTYIKYNTGVDPYTLKSGIDNSGKLVAALIDGWETDGTQDVFTGGLTRVESTSYNKTRYNIDDVINNNVGVYNIVLGSLNVKNDSIADKDEDYLIRMNTNYKAASRGDGDPLKYTTGDPQVKPTSLQTDDDFKTESTVLFMIRQALLTVQVNESDKNYGEQDPYSNAWDTLTTSVNSEQTGYLKGYTVTGYRYNDANASNIILGVLRRNAGEHVGTYDICNILGNPSTISDCNNVSNGDQPVYYNSSTEYYYASYGNSSRYKFADFDNTASTSLLSTTYGFGLITKMNSELISSPSNGINLNRTTRNYALLFIGGDFEIKQSRIIVQPGVNQGKEYAASEYNDPLWQLVVYGESSITKSESADGFNGFTATIDDETFTSASISSLPYTNTDGGYTKDTEVYYARRKTSPTLACTDTTSYSDCYSYVLNIDIDDYTKFTKESNYYKEDANGTYVFAYGMYRPTAGADASGNLEITVVGKLVNQTYTLFTSNFAITREIGKAVGWYTYDEFSDNGADAKDKNGIYVIKENGKQTCGDGDDACRNYLVTFTDRAPEATVDNGVIKAYTTDATVGPKEYKPDGVHGCNSDTTGAYSKNCDTEDSKKIMFEIFKREIVLEFIDKNYTFIYGERYEHYKTNIFEINSTNTGTKEEDVFLCYSDLGDYLVNCTGNQDYGTTEGDTWASIGLEFHLHTSISGFARAANDAITYTPTAYYASGTGAGNKALPAGEYYVYASISNAALQNYKFTYRGGTLLVRAKVTNVQLSGYTMEYADAYYSSYGVGTNYTNYTVTANTCMLDTYYTNEAGLAVSDTGYGVLITGCSETSNIVGNTYGFIIEGLDSSDTIANNFKGRPQRVANTANNAGKYVDVGFYKINVGSIATIKDLQVTLNTAAGGNVCDTDPKGLATSTCVYKTNANNAINYDISYSLTNNEGAYLFVLPANLDVTVDENQAKMYGCAYHTEHYLSGSSYNYGYSYTGGYTNCTGDYDSAYRFKVSGDKDNAATQGDSVQYNVTSSAYASNTYTYALPEGYSTIFKGNLYRVTYDETIEYYDAKNRANAEKYQGQAVGEYTISLGNFDAINNANAAMCDAYNNPVLNGGYQCKNYNVNYYGENTSDKLSDTTNTSNENHTYLDLKSGVTLANLELYTLNYTQDPNGNYLLVNGKYLDLNKLNKTGNSVLISNYVKVKGTGHIATYDKLAQYEKLDIYNTDDETYVYIDTSDDDVDNGTYVQIKDLTISSGYVSINGNNIKLDTISKFKRNYADGANENDKYKVIDDGTGSYVKINGSYVEISSLNKYELDNGKYVPLTDTNATDQYIQVYETVDITTKGASRYSLSAKATSMYATTTNATTNNLFVFVNGSYIPYSSVNLDNVYDANFRTDITDVSTTAVKFVISARIVYVHPEYNVKPYGDGDVEEEITCAQIKEAHGLSNFDGRTDSYCANAGDKIILGTSMYYTVENSLAKSPWTVWTDYEDGTGAQTRSSFNDIQYDVVKGKVKRAEGSVAGKYSYDFIDVTTNDALSGKNYLIFYVVKGNEGSNPYDYTNTYVRTGLNSVAPLNDYIFDECDTADNYAHCFVTSTGEKRTINEYTLKVDNGYVVADQTATGGGITSKSISLIDKYSTNSTANKLDYWYLGFYDNDTAEGRTGELAKWWSNTAVFEQNYDVFKETGSNKAYVCTGEGASRVCTLFPSGTREVYFEIIKRTIYLYAVDTQKTYGEADKYSDFEVAICANNEGYIVDGAGIKCQSDTATKGYGLSSSDKTKFVTGGVMNQNKIKNNGGSEDYIFNGASHLTESFGIYFRRDQGESAGMYTITACAIQSGVDDCTKQAPDTAPNYTIQYLGDNYDIIEVSGVLTINTRQLDITPDANQGFQYGNYTEDGSMPNITFTEKETGKTHGGLVNGGTMFLVENGNYTEITRNGSLYNFSLTGTNAGSYTIDGLSVIKSDGTLAGTVVVTESSSKNSKQVEIGSITYDIIQTARCLINISGLETVCINDAQNEALNMDVTTTSVTDTVNGSEVTYSDALDLNLKDKLFSFGVAYADGVITKAALGTVTYVTNDVYGDTYANPANRYTREETTGDRNALTLQCGALAASNYSRDVCDYKIKKGGLEINEEFNPYSNTIYVYASHSRLYTKAGEVYTKLSDEDYDKFVNNTLGAVTLYVEYGGQYILYDTDKLVSYICTEASGVVTCEYKKDTRTGAVDRYLEVEVSDNNYIIKNVSETVDFKITAAGIEVTPLEKQYKIYGEVDVEIKFDVETTYTVGRTQYQNFANSNIVKLCNGASCISGNSLDAYKYNYDTTNKKYVQNASGTYILLIKGWTVTLDSFAYDEETDVAGLDYGKSRKSDEKYDSSKVVTTTQSPSTAVHFDKFTKYSASITTNRILIGNLYVTGHDQTVGEKNIANGMIVATNANSTQNYTLSFENTNIPFVIVPRPINIQIQNITKVYGQATDSVSCDASVATADCVVGDGILTADENVNLLVNNFNILTNVLDANGIIGGTGSSGTITKTIKTQTYTDGFSVVYSSNTLNLPNETYSTVASTYNVANFTEADVDSGYTAETAYYTANISNDIKNKLGSETNDNLNIEVQRDKTANIARDSDVCLVSNDKGGYCEDVGEYNLKFAYKGTAQTAESTVQHADAQYDAYSGSYWGYNKNYYAIIHNNFVASGWSELETKDVDQGGQGYKSVTANSDIQKEVGDAPSASATLKIRKRSIQIVVETIDTYEYTPDNDGTHLRVAQGTTPETYKYYLIEGMETNRYQRVGTESPYSYIQDNDGDYLYTGSGYVLIEDSAKYNLESARVGEKYVIEQNMDVPELLGVNNIAHHTTYGAITWYDQPLQVRIADELFGKVAYCQTSNTLPADGLDGLRDDACSGTTGAGGNGLHYYDVDENNDSIKDINQEGQDNFFSTATNGYYIITREKSVLYIRNGTGITDGSYEANNYTTEFVNGIFQIDLDETAPVINVKNEFISKEANNGKTNDDTSKGNTYSEYPLTFLDGMKNNYCEAISTNREGTDKVLVTCKNGSDDIVFTYTVESENNGITPTVEFEDINTLVEWFGISSYDPSIMRVGEPVTKRYHERFFMAIQKDFNQKKTGDYSLFIYAQDDAGNISLATMVTLRIIDTTKPVVGTMNLYSAKVECKANSNCALESNWVVAKSSATVNGVYLPINTLTTENLNAMSAQDKSKKFAFDAYTYTFVEDNVYGTYYFITAGTDAKAVKHSGWTNTSAGIYMTVTYDTTNHYGEDNSLTYLDISGYTKYSADSTTITESTTGNHILLGSFVNIANLTKYRKVYIDANGDEQSSGTLVFVPDKVNGTIIRYKGYYYDLAEQKYYNDDGSLNNAVDDAHKVNIYKRTGASGSYVYTVYSGKVPADASDTSTYVIRDGSVYELPSNRYNADGAHNSTGNYINFAQWDHYFTLDEGYTWSKFSRDATEGQLVLGQDGQRLVMIKAVDTGFKYENRNPQRVKNHVSEAYCNVGQNGSCTNWNEISYTSVTASDTDGTKTELYNISDWETYAEAGNRDRKYAYLDTILPSTKLTDKYIEVYEYGCVSVDKCKTNHTELFGTANDGYYFELSRLNRYSSNSDDSLDPNGDYVKFNGQFIDVSDASGRKTTIDSKVYVYLGKTDSLVAVDNLITEKIGERLFVAAASEANFIKNMMTEVVVKDSVIEKAIKDATEANRNAKLQENTVKNQSGIGMGTSMKDDGNVGNVEKTFGATISGNTISEAAIAEKYVQINIYAHVEGSGGITGHSFLTKGNGYYKFIIQNHPSTAGQYQVLACYGGATSINEGKWCTDASNIYTVDNAAYTSIKAVMEDIMAVYKDANSDDANDINFNGNDITFTIDYRTFDIAGNASAYVRKVILITSFTTIIGVDNGGGTPAAVASIDVAQNANLSQVLSSYNIVSTDGDDLKSGERILQTVYYNDQLVSSRQEYDISALSNLDTSVPGTYRIVYSVQRRDGMQYVDGNSVELYVTVKPTVADVEKSAIDYKAAIISLAGIITIGLTFAYINLKKKQEN